MKALKKLRDAYIIWHANRTVIPNFEISETVRKNMIFSGRVQKVGFRLELYTLSQRLDLSGWVKNLEDGRVEAELQGEEAKVNFLITAMKALKRASVDQCVVTELVATKEKETLKIIK